MRSLTTSLMSQYIQLIPPPARDAQMLSRRPLYGARLSSDPALWRQREEASPPLVKIFAFIVLQLFLSEQSAPRLHRTRWTTGGLI